MIGIYRGFLDDHKAAECMLTELIVPLAHGSLSSPDANSIYAKGQRKAAARRLRKSIAAIAGCGLKVFKVTLKLPLVETGSPLVQAMLGLMRTLRHVVTSHAKGSWFRLEVSRVRSGLRSVHVHGLVLARDANEVEALRGAWLDEVGSSMPPQTRKRTLTHSVLLGDIGGTHERKDHATESVADAAIGYCLYAGKAIENDRTQCQPDGYGYHDDLGLLPAGLRCHGVWQKAVARVDVMCDLAIAGWPKVRRSLSTGLLRHQASSSPKMARKRNDPSEGLRGRLLSSARRIRP